MRDEHGNWVAGFTGHIGITNIFAAELWGLGDGLLLCKRLNISCLIVETDVKVIMDVMKNSAYVNQIISLILDDCRQLMTGFQQVQLKHCYRQANRCVDLMARLGANQEQEYILFSSPPVDLAKTLGG